MALESFGSNGNAAERAMTFPIRAGARILGPLPRNARDNYQRQGIVGGTLDTAMHMTGRVGREALNAVTGPAGYILNSTYNAVKSTLGYAIRIPLKAARNAAILPLTSAGEAQDVASEGPPNPNAIANGGAERRLQQSNSHWITRLGREEGLIPSWIPNNQPRA